MKYEDNPRANLEFLKGLTGKELKLYLIGYIQACTHMREALSKGKMDIFSKIMELEEEDKNLLMIASILDRYEDIVKEREQMISRLFPHLLGIAPQENSV